MMPMPVPSLTDMLVKAMKAADTDKDVHTEHCCTRHGCKYAFDGQNITGDPCTVKSGKKKQSFMCEYCDNELREGGLELAYLMNEMYDLGATVHWELGWEDGYNTGYEEATHLHKCGCENPGGIGCDR